MGAHLTYIPKIDHELHMQHDFQADTIDGEDGHSYLVVLNGEREEIFSHPLPKNPVQSLAFQLGILEGFKLAHTCLREDDDYPNFG